MAKEKPEEPETSDMDEAMAQAVDIGETDDEVEESEVEDGDEGEKVEETEAEDGEIEDGNEDEKIKRNWSVLKSTPQLRKSKGKPTKEDMSLKEAVDDSENLTDFLLDFDEEDEDFS